jgi:hypothetical protein
MEPSANDSAEPARPGDDGESVTVVEASQAIRPFPIQTVHTPSAAPRSSALDEVGSESRSLSSRSMGALAASVAAMNTSQVTGIRDAMANVVRPNIASLDSVTSAIANMSTMLTSASASAMTSLSQNNLSVDLESIRSAATPSISGTAAASMGSFSRASVFAETSSLLNALHANINPDLTLISRNSSIQSLASAYNEAAVSRFSKGLETMSWHLAQSPVTRDAVMQAMRAAHQPGAFGFNFKPVLDAALLVERELELDRDLESQLREPLNEMQEAANIDDELLLDIGQALGWWKHITSYRFSTAGLIIGTSLAMTRLVLGLGQGELAPLLAFDSLACGASAYILITGFLDRGDPQRQAESE